MAITLAEAKVGMADKVDQQIVDMFRRSSLLLDNMVFDNVISPGTGGSTLTYGYIQLKSPSTAAVRTINSEYTPGEAKREQKTTNAIIMGGSFQIDRVLQNTAGAADELAFQAEQKIKATANYFHNLVINGDVDNGNFDGLKKVAEDIHARSAELGFDAFSSAGLDSSSSWRFSGHLANMPLYYEFRDDKVTEQPATIKGTYLDNYKKIWDLYINNSTCAGADLSAKTGDDSRNEFLAGKAVFFQNGSWEYGNLKGTFTDDELVMIPIYVGAGDEANQGLCTGTENYWCVNKDASEEDIAATLTFINWCVTEGAETLANDMGFVIPFDTAAEAANLFVKQDVAYTAAGKNPVSWTFTTMPSEEWKNGVGSALTAYAADQTDANWAAVVTAFVDGWASEYALLG